jgi:mRNA-degrading endonuclease toxin of MazEF toxin-antitoxin module
MKQYEIWWADLPSPVGRQPVLLLTRSAAYAYLNKAIVAEITTTIRGIPQEVPMGEPEGLVPSVANLDNIHVVAKRLLSSRIGVLAATREQEVKRALGYALDWAELKAP